MILEQTSVTRPPTLYGGSWSWIHRGHNYETWLIDTDTNPTGGKTSQFSSPPKPPPNHLNPSSYFKTHSLITISPLSSFKLDT